MNRYLVSAIVNSGSSSVSFLIVTACTFVVRTYLILSLGVEIIGLDALFGSIFFILSFAELGIGAAISFAFHKPLHENNYAILRSLLQFFGKIYRYICLALIVLAIIVSLFLQYIVDIPLTRDIYICFFLYMLGSASSYLFSEYKSFLLVAQLNYIDSVTRSLMIISRSIIQISILVALESYLFFLIPIIATNLLHNMLIRSYVLNKFPALKDASFQNITDEEMRVIRKNILGSAFHRFGSIIVTGTDNILISSFVGIGALGLYSNYALLFRLFVGLLSQILTPLVGIVGLKNVSTSSTESQPLFNCIFIPYSFFVINVTLFFIYSSNALISIWLGPRYVINDDVVILLGANLFIILLRRPSILFIDSLGLHWPIRYKSIFEAAINLGFSLFFILYFGMGITGVLLGTLASNLLTNFWWEPYIIYKNIFKSSLWDYYWMYGKSSISAIVTVLVCEYFFNVQEGFMDIAIVTLANLASLFLCFVILFKNEPSIHRISNLIKIFLFKKDDHGNPP